MTYVPLHVLSTNSPGMGMMTTSEIVDRAAFLGMPAVALTDRWNTYGHFEFAKYASSRGLKPLFGAVIRHLSLTGHEKAYNLTLIAEDNEGYENLVRLVSLHHAKEGDPHVTADELSAHAGGIIALSGGLEGEANQAVLHGNLAMQREAVEKLRDIFGPPNLFLEVFTHNHEREQLVMDKTVLLSKRLGVQMVVTNSDRFVSRDDSVYYEIMRNLAGNITREENPENLREYYLKSRKELEPQFYFIEHALEVSGEIADRCRVNLIEGTTISFTDEPDEDLILSERCNRIFKSEFHGSGSGDPDGMKNRMMSELERASMEEVSGFLLFLEKLFRKCRREGEWTELVGSEICESLTAYLLGILPLNPADHGLVFESFGSPAPGVAPPLELLRSRGPRESFMKILDDLLPGYRCCFQLQREDSSFTTLVRELCENLDIERSVADEMIQAINSSGRRESLKQMLESSETLSRIYNSDTNIRRILHSAAALRGRVSHFVHSTSRIVVLPPAAERRAARVAGDAGEEFVMLSQEAIAAHGGWMLVVQQSHYLSALAGAIRGIRSDDGEPFPGREVWSPRNLNDPATFDMLCEGDTTGVYLLESRGVRDLLTRIRPRRFDDLVNVISLYRPAPLEGRLWQKYVENGEKGGTVSVPHRAVAGALEMTRGLLIYREQVREILLDTAGLSERDAAFVERALETKSASDLQSARLEFIRGALEKGIDEQGAQKIFDYLLHNVQYTFDKVYSCTQAYLSYRSAFLKAHHPAEYFCAILDSSGDSRDRKDRYLAYLKSHGPDIFPPDVNFSGTGFITENGAIRAPMAEACDMTEEEAGTVLSEREGGLYGSLDDLLNRLSGKLAMETAVNMAECGLFDSISEGRDEAKAEVLAFYDEHARAGEFFRTRPDGGRTKRADDDQLSLFDD